MPSCAGSVAGHIIEWRPQARGGNYSFAEEFPDLALPPGFRNVEVSADGSSVIRRTIGSH